MGKRAVFVAGVVLALVAGVPGIAGRPGVRAASADSGRADLRPTAHPPVPRDLTDLWLVPARPGAPSAAVKNLARAVQLIEQGSYTEARPLIALPALGKTPVASYAAYYAALVDLRAGQPVRARQALRAVGESARDSVLAEWANLAEAEAAETAGDAKGAAALYAGLLDRKPAEPDLVLAGLARTRLLSGDGEGALEAWRRIYFDHPLSGHADQARRQMAALQGARAAADVKRELQRAERLFSFRRYAQALDAFQSLAPLVPESDRELVDLRQAECHFYLGRHRQALAGTKPYLERASRKAEARFFHLSSLRGVGDHAGYLEQARQLVKDFPDSSWAEETLNNLGTHHIIVDEDADAARAFADYLERFPQGRHAPRAAWKLGWWHYRKGEFESTVKVFERAAADFPRSDYRPAWLYWTGRAYAQLAQPERAASRYALTVADYLHSYYGRLAEEQLRELNGSPTTARAALVRASTGARAAAPDASRPKNAERVTTLIAAGLHTTADAEIRYAQRQWGTSPALEATRAWILREQGEYRPAINMMKRAYPQYMSDQGHLLPDEALRVIFPLDHWALIERHAKARGLDPYLVAALVAQESSFDAKVVSSARAYGLMQILPSTGRRLARKAGVRRFTTSHLTQPEMNVRLGTLYFRNLIDQFGAHHYALASYNAGESRVVRWMAERGRLPQDEFIDDIPFPETQNYVKKILGTAEDYRRLYGDASQRPTSGGR